MITAFEAGITPRQVASPHPLQDCKQVADKLSVELTQGGKVVVVDGAQVVVLPPARREYKAWTHQFHENVKVMTTNASAIWFWSPLVKKISDI